MSRCVSISLLTLALPLTQVAFAQIGPWTTVENAELHSPTPMHAGDYGSHLRLHGTTLLIGSRGGTAGTVHILDGSSGAWIEEASVRPASGPSTGACDISGDTLVVGAYTDAQAGFQSGAVFVFERIGGAWTETARIVAPNPLPDDRFGYDVVLEGDTLVVGAPRHLTNDLGSALVFERSLSTWSFVTELSMPNTSGADQFGHSLALEGDVLVVGAPDDANARGACHVFRHLGGAWSFEQTLTGSTSVHGDYVGFTVALSGDTLALGGYFITSNMGAVFVFRDGTSGWGEEALLQHHDAEANDWLGVGVALDGDLLLTCAEGDEEGRPQSGAVHMFERSGTTWTHKARFIPSDPDADSRYGNAVAVGQDVAIVGAYRSSNAAPFGGAVYVFDFVDGDVSNVCAAMTGSSEVPARLALRGSTSLAAADLTLDTVGSPSGSYALFFYGTTPAAFPFGDGVLCISPFTPGLGRLTPAVATDGHGTSTRVLAPSDIPAGVLPGDTLYFQCMFRDMNAAVPCVQLSDSLRITFSG